MKNKKLLLLIAIFAFIGFKNVYAFDSSNYKNRNLCGNYELAGFHSDGYIDKVGCYSNYNDARNDMKNNGATDLAIMTRVNGETKIIDANVALLDLTINPEALTYYYTNSELTGSSFTYMDNGSLYGGVDGIHLDSAYSNAKGKWTTKVKIADFTGWIGLDTCEIVPITWVKSSSSYTITDSSIRHNIVSKIQNTYTGSRGTTIGPKPEMLNVGTYYSFDGHYFYRDLETMIKDNKNNNYNNSVNKNNPYYNYYMYLSNHTKTSYSSINIDEYIRNNLGYKESVYGTSASDNTSKLYGMGTYFYYAQEKYGVNAILALSLSRNESANGTSYLAINKNNGFGLNAVDTNPIEGASWYPTFASSILGYAYKWVLNGYAHPSDWRYYGPQFGDKLSGMNVKYASDSYWSEKMASYYYSLDKALGMQDYNYYQLGIVKDRVNAYKDPSTSSKVVYVYPESNDGVVIVDEVIRDNEKWYKLVSDLNVNSNYDEVNGDYNWDRYVYVKASSITKINQSKNGYIAPTSVFEYQDKDYEYDLYVENNEFKPKVAISTKNTDYYYDSTLSSKLGKTLLKDRYVMVFSVAYQNNMPVAYLVTSDYFHDQKHWVKADAIKFTDTTYGKVKVNVSGNCYTWVNYNKEDASYSVISGLYTYTYVPILESSEANGFTWYKVPVNLTGNDNIYGYTIASSNEVSITTSKSIVVNIKPTISASDKELDENDSFDPLKDVTAIDPEDGDITNKIEVTTNTVDTSVAGTYKVVYKVTDSANNTVTKEIKVVVKANNAPVITANDVILEVGDTFNPKNNVTAIDFEDGDITNKIEIITNTVDTNVVGVYKVIYSVTDSKNKTTTKEIKVTVKEYEEDTALEGINLSEFNIQEANFIQKESLFYFDYLKEINNKLEIKGYNVIKGIDNNLNKEIKYILKFESIDNQEVYAQILNRITDNNEITRPVNSSDNNDYTYSWFKGSIDFKDIPNGDYKMYIISISEDNYYSISLVSNKVLKTQASSYQGDKYVTTRNNYYDDSIPLELIVRDEKIGTKTAKSTYNIYNQYRTLEFANNKLHIKGTSYSYGMNLGKNNNVERKIIFENTTTYTKYIYDLGSTDQGLYQAGTTLGDNQPKDKAWFDANIDITNLPKGKYAIYISTVSNVSDYGEFTEALGRNVSNINMISGNKTYTFSVIKDKRYRLELTVE